MISSPSSACAAITPSASRNAPPRVILSVILSFSGNTTGLAARENAQSGVNRIAAVCGAIIGPPAESEYAVEPVGVHTSAPSPDISSNG